MIVKIASIEVEINDSLLSDSVTEILKPFEIDSRNSNGVYFFVRPLEKIPTFLHKSERRIENEYLENENEIYMINKHSICRIVKDTHLMEVAPYKGIGNPCYNFLIELKFLFAEMSVQMNGFMFHAAGVSYNDAGYLFTGPSGAGKSTLARLLNEEMNVINDETILMLPQNGTFYLYSSPFGSATVNEIDPFATPVKQIYHIKKCITTKIEQLGMQAALMTILSGVCIFPTTDYTAQKVFDNAANIADCIPCYNFWFSKSDTPTFLIKTIFGTP